MAVSSFRSLGQQVATLKFALSEEARSLDLLRAIEETIDSLAWMRSRLDGDSELVESTIATINESAHVVIRLDADGSVCASLQEAQSVVEALHKDMAGRRDAACLAGELRENDGVIEAYDEAIDAAARLHNAINTVRWCIMEHDADLCAEAQGTIHGPDDIDRMIADLHAS